MTAKSRRNERARDSESGFTAEERAAMKEAVRERRARSRAKPGDGERDVLAKIAAMEPSDRVMAQRLHAIMKAHAPGLIPRTWYGMPAYANPEGQVVCYFRDARKFKTRYATLGFSDEAHLDAGRLWPTEFALQELGPEEEAQIVALVRKAVS